MRGIIEKGDQFRQIYVPVGVCSFDEGDQTRLESPVDSLNRIRLGVVRGCRRMGISRGSPDTRRPADFLISCRYQTGILCVVQPPQAAVIHDFQEMIPLDIRAELRNRPDHRQAFPLGDAVVSLGLG